MEQSLVFLIQDQYVLMISFEEELPNMIFYVYFLFQDTLFSLSVPGSYLANVLTVSMSMKGSGAFLAYCGINTPDQGKTWLVNGIDISKSGLMYNVATISYEKNSQFNDPQLRFGRI